MGVGGRCAGLHGVVLGLVWSGFVVCSYLWQGLESLWFIQGH